AAIPAFRTRMVSPGPLAAAHAGLSCDQCHAPFENSSHTTCLSSGCHADIEIRHPFEPASWTGHGGTLAAARIGTNGCTICHSMHAGEDIKPSYDEVERTSCYYCHDRDVPDVGAEVKWRETFVTFDHQKHVSRGLGCADCHVKAAAGGEGDFAQVRYERCQECHSGVDGIPTLTTSWHGSDSGNCQWCHENTGDPELKTVERSKSREIAHYTVKRRVHDFAAHAGLKDVEGRTCISCHRRGGETLLAGTTVDAPFEHALHVATLSDATACAKCHGAIAESKTLAAGARPSIEECAACHHPPGQPNENLVLARTSGADADETERRRDFPHAFHTTERALAHPLLADGCLTCHDLGLDSEDGTRGPTTKPIANDCAQCHSDHALIGGGGCAGCHTPKSNGGLGHLAFTGVGVERVAVDFPHHIAGHQQESGYLKCDACHSEIGNSTELGPGLTLPSWPGSCQVGGCHVDETETRSFHFTGSR
ncbi:MAG: cytochrome c3 family protein, partial [Planctomycetota bacterium]